MTSSSLSLTQSKSRASMNVGRDTIEDTSLRRSTRFRSLTRWTRNTGVTDRSEALTSRSEVREPSLTSGDVETANDLIRQVCPDKGFHYKGRMYYGIENWELRQIQSQTLRTRTVKTLLALLKVVAEACRKQGLVPTLEGFESAVEGSCIGATKLACRSFVCHGRRILSRLLVYFQGYYDFNPDEKAKLDLYSPYGRFKPDPSRDSAICQIYQKCPAEWSAFQFLKWQLCKLSEQLTVRKASVAANSASSRGSSGGTSYTSEADWDCPDATESKPSSSIDKEPVSEPLATSSTRRRSLIVKLRIEHWDSSCDISQRRALHQLAHEGLRDNENEDEVENFLASLCDHRYAYQLPDCHRKYFRDQLLPALESGSDDRCDHLAVVLGFFDWSRQNPSADDIKRISLQENDGELFALLWSWGMALSLPFR